MTTAEIDTLNRDYEFVGFRRHFDLDYSLARFLLSIGGYWLVAWFLWLMVSDVPDMIYMKRVNPANFVIPV